MYAKDCKEMTYCTTNDGMSMFEKRTGKKPDFEKCHVFGAPVTAFVKQTAKGNGSGREFRIPIPRSSRKNNR